MVSDVNRPYLRVLRVRIFLEGHFQRDRSHVDHSLYQLVPRCLCEKLVPSHPSWNMESHINHIPNEPGFLSRRHNGTKVLVRSLLQPYHVGFSVRIFDLNQQANATVKSENIHHEAHEEHEGKRHYA